MVPGVNRFDNHTSMFSWQALPLFGTLLASWAGGETGRHAALRWLWEQSLGGSSPLLPTNWYTGSIAQLVRASRLHREGPPFESEWIHQHISLGSSVVEQWPEEPRVVSSILTPGTKINFINKIIRVDSTRSNRERSST